MKTLKTILSQRPIYLDNWDRSTEKGIFLAFEPIGGDGTQLSNLHKGERILFASYTYEGYESSAWVLFSKGGKLWEVSGSQDRKSVV